MTERVLVVEIADEGYKKRWHNVSRKYRRLVDMLHEVQEHAGQKK